MAARVQPTTYAVTQKEPCGGHPQACTEDMIQVRRGCMVAWFLHSLQFDWKLRPLQVHTERVLEILAQQQWRCNEGTVELAAALHNNSTLCTSWFSVSLLQLAKCKWSQWIKCYLSCAMSLLYCMSISVHGTDVAVLQVQLCQCALGVVFEYWC